MVLAVLEATGKVTEILELTGRDPIGFTPLDEEVVLALMGGTMNVAGDVLDDEVVGAGPVDLLISA